MIPPQTIFFDLDGVLANFDEKAARLLKTPYWSRDSTLLWKALDKDPHFYADLKVIGEMVDMLYTVIDRIGIERVQILSAVGKTNKESSTADKIAWVQRHLPSGLKVNISNGGRNKYTILVDYPKAVLIDDHDTNLEPWIYNGGIGILHKDPVSTWTKLLLTGVMNG